jgi:hypothetical protein
VGGGISWGVAEQMNYGRSSPVLVSRAFPFDRTSNRGPKGAYSSSDLRIVLPELVEAHGADAIKRELIPFCLVSYRVHR